MDRDRYAIRSNWIFISKRFIGSDSLIIQKIQVSCRTTKGAEWQLEQVWKIDKIVHNENPISVVRRARRAHFPIQKINIPENQHLKSAEDKWRTKNIKEFIVYQWPDKYVSYFIKAVGLYSTMILSVHIAFATRSLISLSLTKMPHSYWSEF